MNVGAGFLVHGLLAEQEDQNAGQPVALSLVDKNAKSDAANHFGAGHARPSVAGQAEHRRLWNSQSSHRPQADQAERTGGIK